MAILVVDSPLLLVQSAWELDILLRSGVWTDDGLGGIYNKEGWTGRRTESDQLRISKAHLIQVGQGGGTPLCPFEAWRLRSFSSESPGSCCQRLQTPKSLKTYLFVDAQFWQGMAGESFLLRYSVC